jgi:hypothetical protein
MSTKEGVTLVPGKSISDLRETRRHRGTLNYEYLRVPLLCLFNDAINYEDHATSLNRWLNACGALVE